MTQAAKLEAALAERTQQMSEAETTLKLKEMEFERRVTSLQKEHAAKLATVLQQAAAVAPAARGSLQEAAGLPQKPKSATMLMTLLCLAGFQLGCQSLKFEMSSCCQGIATTMTLFPTTKLHCSGHLY